MNTNRMTSGSPAKHIFKFAIPLMLGNVFQQMYTFADTAVVGKALGVNALAALGATEWMIFLVMGAIQGITHGFSVFISQSFGSREEKKLKKSVINSYLLSGGIAVLFTVAGQIIIIPALHILNAPPEVFPMAKSYLRIIYAGIPVSVAYNMLAAVLRALGDSRTPLKAITISSVCNVLLDICFVLFFHWGILGAALATVIAEVISAGYCFLAVRKIDVLKFRADEIAFDRRVMCEELKLGVPIGLQNIITAAGGLAVQSIINGFGVLFIAGYTAANKLYGLLEIPASSYGYTMSTFSGQNAGAGRNDRIKKGLAACLVISIGTALLMSCIMLFAGENIVSCFLSGERENVLYTTYIACDFLTILAVFFPLLYILYTLRGCIQGLGNSTLPMVSSFIQLVMRLLCALFLTKILGEYGVFWGEILAWAGADILLLGGFIAGPDLGLAKSSE